MASVAIAAPGGAMPARALQHRIRAAAETPSWAGFLPQQQPFPLAAPQAACSDGSHERRQGQPGAGRPRAPPVPRLALTGSVWRLSRDPSGCREVQAALEAPGSEEVRATVASELRGHVWEALRCPHANYVVQKCIATMRPEASQFVVDELLRRGPGTIAQAARHRFGCRILERLLENCRPCQLTGLVEDILEDAVALASHPYGNYVVQHVLEHGKGEHQARLADLLARHVVAMGPDGYASAVIAKALAHGSHASRLKLARATLAAPGLLAAMARMRFGHSAVKLALQLLEDVPAERAAARRELEADILGLRSSRYGRLVALCLEQRTGRGGGDDGGGGAKRGASRLGGGSSLAVAGGA